MGSKKSQKRRGPSRPVDPRARYVPGRPARRGPDTFGMVLIGISVLVLVIIFFFLATRNNQQATTGANPTNAAGQSTTPPADPTQQEVTFLTQTANLPRIPLQDAKALYDAGNVKIFDVRPAADYQQQHIKGAINIPSTQITTRSKEVPMTGNVIVYCQ